MYAIWEAFYLDHAEPLLIEGAYEDYISPLIPYRYPGGNPGDIRHILRDNRSKPGWISSIGEPVC